jgi:hypothetical protein
MAFNAPEHMPEICLRYHDVDLIPLQNWKLKNNQLLVALLLQLWMNRMHETLTTLVEQKIP